MKKAGIFIINFIAIGFVLFPNLVRYLYENSNSMFFSIIVTVSIVAVAALIACMLVMLGKDVWIKRDRIKKISKNTLYNIALFVVCLFLIAFVCGSSVNELILEHEFPKIVQLEVLPDEEKANSNIWIYFTSMHVLESEDFEELEENHFVSETGFPVLRLEITEVTESSIILITNSESSNIKVSLDGHSWIYSCPSDVGQQILSLVYYEGLSLQRMLIYCATLIAMAVLLWVCIQIVKINWHKTSLLADKIKLLHKKHIVFALFWVGFSIYACLNYNMVLNFLEENASNADAGWYWYSGDTAFLMGERFSIKRFIESFIYGTRKIPFRGYFVPAFYGIIKFIFGRLLSWNPLIAMFIILSFLTSFMNCILLPSIYSLLNKKDEVKTWQIAVINICFFVFLRGHILWPMADLLPFFFVICSLYFFLRFIDSRKGNALFWEMFFITAATLCRQSYSILLYAELLWLVIWVCRNHCELKMVLKICLCACLGVFLLGGPQISINFLRDQSFGYLGGSIEKYMGDQSLIENSIQLSIDTATQAWPYFLKNSLGILMKNSIYPDMNNLNLVDFAYIFISHPAEFICFLFSKLFMAIDIRTPLIYPEPPYIEKNIYGYLLLSANAVVWSAFVLVLADKQKRNNCFNKKEVAVGMVDVILLTFPLLAVHIEWRYFISLYYLAYYVVCFSLPKWILKASRKERKRFIMMLIALSALFIGVSIGNYANLPWNNPGGFIF